MTLPLLINKIRTDGPRGAIGNSFGLVRKEFVNGTLTPKWHRGWDLEAPPNTQVFAIADGIVVATLANVPGYGNTSLLRIRNPKYDPALEQSVGIANYPELYVLYAHLSSFERREGDVRRGMPIARTGVSGNAAGEVPHLHIELLADSRIHHTTLRFDPGELLGYELYTCSGRGMVNQDVFSCQQRAAASPH